MAMTKPVPFDSKDRRFGERKPTQDPSTLRNPENQPIDVTVSDLSISGFRVTCPCDLAIDDTVHLGLPGSGSFAARVIWRDGDRYGCEFVTPLAHQVAADAFERSIVTSFTLQRPAPEATAFPLPADDKWPRAARGWLMVGGAALAWAGIGWAVFG